MGTLALNANTAGNNTAVGANVDSIAAATATVYTGITSNCDVSTALPKEKFSKSSFIYPNPSTGALFVVIPVLIQSNIVVSVCNVLGETILSSVQNNNSLGEFKFDLSGNDNGVYFVKITTNNETITKRVVISKE